jgi:hypothetical protein
MLQHRFDFGARQDHREFLRLFRPDYVLNGAELIVPLWSISG